MPGPSRAARRLPPSPDPHRIVAHYHGERNQQDFTISSSHLKLLGRPADTSYVEDGSADPSATIIERPDGSAEFSDSTTTLMRRRAIRAGTDRGGRCVIRRDPTQLDGPVVKGT